jgi:hypothetical protein
VSNESLNRERAADAAIDRAVREMMSAEPRPGFRHRVLARLSEPRAVRRALWPQLSLAAAMAAALMLAFVWTRPMERAPETTVVVSHPAPDRPEAPSPEPEPRRAPRAAAKPPATPSDSRASGMPERGLVYAASIEPGVVTPDDPQDAPPAGPARLVIPRLESPEPSIPAITIEAITIPEIAVTPLPPGR